MFLLYFKQNTAYGMRCIVLSSDMCSSDLLNVFLRDFMLHEPETYGIAARLVNECGELNEAHQEVVAARKQIQTLTPARDEHGELDRVKLESNGLQAIQTAIDQYREHRRKLLLDERIAELEVDREGARQETLHLATIVENECQRSEEHKSDIR